MILLCFPLSVSLALPLSSVTYTKVRAYFAAVQTVMQHNHSYLFINLRETRTVIRVSFRRKLTEINFFLYFINLLFKFHQGFPSQNNLIGPTVFPFTVGTFFFRTLHTPSYTRYLRSDLSIQLLVNEWCHPYRTQLTGVTWNM